MLHAHPSLATVVSMELIFNGGMNWFALGFAATPAVMIGADAIVFANASFVGEFKLDSKRDPTKVLLAHP